MRWHALLFWQSVKLHLPFDHVLSTANSNDEHPGRARRCLHAQVSCGPYHTAAVSATGALFTWGDGLCGKLGHGTLDSCSKPRQVDHRPDAPPLQSSSCLNLHVFVVLYLPEGLVSISIVQKIPRVSSPRVFSEQDILKITLVTL